MIDNFVANVLIHFRTFHSWQLVETIIPVRAAAASGAVPARERICAVLVYRVVYCIRVYAQRVLWVTRVVSHGGSNRCSPGTHQLHVRHFR